MASNIIEFFGYAPGDNSPEAKSARKDRLCPSINRPCTKTLSDSTVSGACTLQATRGGPVICCPIRLYANRYQILREIATVAFGGDIDLLAGGKAVNAPVNVGRSRVAVFGKAWGGELRLPTRGQSGGYFVDWVLAKLTDVGKLQEFIAIEVQSIDTTGNYRGERDAYLRGDQFTGSSTAGFNWENVNKRILPQLIYKGNVLQRERLCSKGLFFVCPTPVLGKIKERLGNALLEYPPQTGSITFVGYDVGPAKAPGELRDLNRGEVLSSHVAHVANAFVAPSNLPDANVYEQAILSAL